MVEKALKEFRGRKNNSGPPAVQPMQTEAPLPLILDCEFLSSASASPAALFSFAVPPRVLPRTAFS